MCLYNGYHQILSFFIQKKILPSINTANINIVITLFINVLVKYTTVKSRYFNI